MGLSACRSLSGRPKNLRGYQSVSPDTIERELGEILLSLNLLVGVLGSGEKDTQSVYLRERSSICVWIADSRSALDRRA